MSKCFTKGIGFILPISQKRKIETEGASSNKLMDTLEFTGTESGVELRLFWVSG